MITACEEKVEREQQRLPDGPITVGIDSGNVRAGHKQGDLK
jgi:hypothetical protein